MKYFLTIVLCAVIATLASGELDGSLASDSLDQSSEGSFAPFVVNGISARPGDIKYHVTIYVLKGGKWRFGSGALVAATWVLTEASLVSGSKEARVYYGSDRLDTAKVAFGKKLISHPKYNPRSKLYNFGLLRLSAPVVVSHLVAPVALPSPTWQKVSFDNKYVMISGFGGKDLKSTNRVLQYAALRVTPAQSCKKEYPKLAGPLVFCAARYNRQKNGYPGYGDNGAPLILRVGKVSTLIGLSAYGKPEDIAKGHLAGFNNVAAVVNWIAPIIKT